ncbi:hypothetical protein [Nostoc sp. UIC 10630]|uniref:hypothetical protein n=1 Tax=Nostoc sp. UIC 10630 TaxID=2100146 RepID=UPI0013D2820D|nr:hypothetical protein [Nostoc sp. UIC 10630]NEU80686.1 hypothetical protein [Nostoc sp. UIC 10630]
MVAGKCSKCDTFISYVNIGTITGKVNGKDTWNCISYSCPSCNTILNIQIDPVALKGDTIEGVIKRLNR